MRRLLVSRNMGSRGAGRRDLKRIKMRLHREKSARLRQAESLLANPSDVKARIGFEQHSAKIKNLKQMRQTLLSNEPSPVPDWQRSAVVEQAESKPHQIHSSLVVSSSRHGPMLYVFCRDRNCRRRIRKAKSISILGLPAKEAIGEINEECEHLEVVLKRAKHFDISVTCKSCNKMVLVRNVYVENWNVTRPETKWSKGAGGDSRLPKGDPRLLRTQY